MSKHQIILPSDDIDEYLDNLIFEVGDVRKLNIKNPFMTREWYDKTMIPELMVQTFRNPDYLHFLAKYLLNIDLFPYQAVWLQMMWNKQFPMIIGGRGSAKSFMLTVYIVLRAILQQGVKIVVVGAALRQSMVLFNYCQKIWEDSPILRDICGKRGEQGPKRDIHLCLMRIGQSEIRFLPLGTGDKIRGQRAQVILADEFSCLSEDTLVETDIGLLRISDSFNKSEFNLINKNGDLEAPTKFIKTPLTDVYEIKTKYGYTFKCSNIHKVLTADGWKLGKDLTDKDYLVFENKYKFPTKLISKNGVTVDTRMAWLMGLLVSEGTVTNKNYISIKTTDFNLVTRFLETFPDYNVKVYSRPAYKDPRGWDCKQSFSINIHNTVLRSQLLDLGIEYVTAHDKKIPWSILQSPKDIVLSFLAGLFEGDGSCFLFDSRDLSRLGISYYTVSEKLAIDVHVLLSKLDILAFRTTRDSKISDNKQWMIRVNGKYAHNICKMLNIKEWLDIASKAEDPLEVDEFVTFCKDKNKWRANAYYNGKNYFIKHTTTREEAVALSREFLDGRSKCLKVSKVTLLDKQQHLYDYYLPETNSFFGNGFTQHNSIPSDIFETVVRGFAAVKSHNLFESVMSRYKAKKLKELGYLIDEDLINKGISTSTALPGNQIIISGTAYYQFNHFYKYWQYYRAIITSGGDPEILRRDFPDMTIAAGIDPRDYCIIRMPYDALPEGIMDPAILSQGQATMDRTIFQMEYQSCLCPGTLVLTNYGYKNIEDISVGDMVLTHKGRFRKVIKRTYRVVDEDIVKFKTFGYSKDIRMTKNHPVWIDGDDFLEAEYVDDYVNLANLKELSNLKEIDISKYTNNYCEIDDKIYARGSQNQLSNDITNDIRNSNLSIQELAAKYNSSYGRIWAVKNDKRIPKGSIPKIIPLNYDFGLILGYYASEGSTGSDGRSVSFALDGHVDISLEAFVTELSNAIFNVFGQKPKQHPCDNNVVSVVINNRIVVDLMKSICPGISTTKVINPEILFSNPEFMKGFIKGYWNGDGNKSYKFASAASCSLQLLSQVKLCLSYFGIGSSFRYIKESTAIFRNTIYPCSQAYALCLYGTNFAKLMSWYGIDYKAKRIDTKILSLENKTKYECMNKEFIPYKGYVYNLEVEEDHSYSLPNMTVHNCFPSDSDGFFLASWIAACTCGKSGVETEYAGKINFGPKLIGDQTIPCVMGIDPASEDDNFSISITESHRDHGRLVYQWSTNRRDFEKKKRDGLIADNINDYNTFCIRHIRNLIRRFNIQLIALDAGGGGLTIREGLRDPAKMMEGDRLIYDMDDEHTAGLNGDRILKMVEFANYQWRREAHYALRKDLGDRKILFPMYDAAAIEAESVNETKQGVLIDTLQDCYTEIEYCKLEMTYIKHSQTPTGQEKWDVPNIVGMDSEKVRKRLKRDRFTSLLLANWGRRLLVQEGITPDYIPIGSVAKSYQPIEGGLAYYGKGVNKMRNAHSYQIAPGESNEIEGVPGRKVFF